MSAGKYYSFCGVYHDGRLLDSSHGPIVSARINILLSFGFSLGILFLARYYAHNFFFSRQLFLPKVCATIVSIMSLSYIGVVTWATNLCKWERTRQYGLGLEGRSKAEGLY